MSDLFGNHIVSFPTRRLKSLVSHSLSHNLPQTRKRGVYGTFYKHVDIFNAHKPGVLFHGRTWMNSIADVVTPQNGAPHLC